MSRGLHRSEEWLAEQKAKRHVAGDKIESKTKTLIPSTNPPIQIVSHFVNGFPPAKTWSRALVMSLPYPPSVNSYWRNIGPGRTILSAKAREYRKAMLATIGARKPLLGRLRVVVELSPPDKRRRDLDNCMKSLFDALQHAGVYRDDEQIDFFSVQRKAVVKGGSCRVDIQET